MIDENENLEAQDLSQDMLAVDEATQVLGDDEKPRKPRKKSRWGGVTGGENVGRLDYKYEDIVDFEDQLQKLRTQIKSGTIKFEDLSPKEQEGLKTLDQHLKLKDVVVKPSAKKNLIQDYISSIKPSNIIDELTKPLDFDGKDNSTFSILDYFTEGKLYAPQEQEVVSDGGIFYDPETNTYRKKTWDIGFIEPTLVTDVKTIAKLNTKYNRQASISPDAQVYASENGRQYVIEGEYWKVKEPKNSFYYYVTDPNLIGKLNTKFGQKLSAPDKTKTKDLALYNTLDRNFANDTYNTFNSGDDINQWVYGGGFGAASFENKIKEFEKKYNIRVEKSKPTVDRVTFGITDALNLTDRTITIVAPNGDRKEFFIDSDGFLDDVQGFVMSKAKPSFNKEYKSKPSKTRSETLGGALSTVGELLKENALSIFETGGLPQKGLKKESVTPDYKSAQPTDALYVKPQLPIMYDDDVLGLITPKEYFSSDLMGRKIKQKEEDKKILNQTANQYAQAATNPTLSKFSNIYKTEEFTPGAKTRYVANRLKKESEIIKSQIEDFKKEEEEVSAKMDRIENMKKFIAEQKEAQVEFQNLIDQGKIDPEVAKQRLEERKDFFQRAYGHIDNKYLEEFQVQLANFVKKSEDMSSIADPISSILSNSEKAIGIEMMQRKDQGSFFGGVLKSIVDGGLSSLDFGMRVAGVDSENSKKFVDGISSDLLGEGVTKEYEEDANYFYKGVTALTKSMAAAATGGKFGLFGMGYTEMSDQLAPIKGISDEEKIIYSALYGTVSMIMEEKGLEEIFKGELGNKVSNYIIKNTISGLGKNATKEVVDAAIINNTKLFLLEMGIKAGVATGSETLTEVAQLTAEYGTKWTINELHGTDFFNGQLNWKNYAKDIKETVLTTLTGTGAVSIISQSPGVINRGMNALNTKEEREALVAAARATGMDELVVANLRAGLLSGKYSKEDAQSILENFKIVQQKVNTIPKEMPVQEQAVALDLIIERDALNSAIEGVDPALAAPVTERVKEINETLKQIGYAVQEPSTESVLQRQQEGTGETGGGRGGMEQIVQGKEVTREGETKAVQEEVVINKPVIQSNSKTEVDRVKSLSNDAEDGATFNLDGTKYEGKGLIVPVVSKNTTAEEVTPEMISDFVEEHKDKIGDNETVKVGIYKFPNSNKVSIDLNILAPESSREQAIEFGKNADQESLFDLGTFENVKTGGTGVNPMQFTNDQFKEISKAFAEGRVPNVFGKETTIQEVTITPETSQTVTERINKETDTKRKKVFTAVQKVLSAIPNSRIILHDNVDAFVAGVAKSAGITNDEAISQGVNNNRGSYVNGDIHINLETAGVTTVFHEAFHDLLAKKGMENNALLDMAKGLKSVISDKALKTRLDDFVSNYEQGERSEEYTTELGAIMAEAQKELSTTKFQQFKTLVNKIAKKLGMPVVFSAASTAQDAVDFMNSMAGKLGKGEKILTDGLQTTIVSDKIKAEKPVNVNTNQKLTFVKQSDIIDIKSLIDEIVSKNQTVWFWVADQLGRGFYFDSVINGEHYLDAGPSYALDPENKSKGIIWASGANPTTISKNIEKSDYIFIVSGSPQLSKLFNKSVANIVRSRIESKVDFNEFKDNILNSKPTKPILDIISKYNSYDELFNGSDRKSFIIAVNEQQSKNTQLKKLLESYDAFIDPNELRDGFYKDNNFQMGDVMLVLKPEKIGDKSKHSTYETDIIGSVVGVPDMVINSYDLMPEEIKNKYKENLERFQQQQVVAPYGMGVKQISKIKAQRTAPGNKLFNEPLKDAGTIAKSYMKSVGMDYVPVEKITKLDENLSKRISDAYDKMKNDPNDPKVKAAYEAMAKETLDQHKAIIDQGYKVEINNTEPYSDSGAMIEDLRENKRMKIFSTESGFGDEPITDEQRKENPLLRDSGFKDVNGETLLVNDVFRFVHDFFGHAKLGNSFGPIGEENAWRVHSEMYSPEARKAMTSETRGQNSWVNFSGVNDAVFKKRDKARQLRKEGKIEEANQMVGEVYEDMKFADQKVGLLPDFAFEEGRPSKIKAQKPSKQEIEATAKALEVVDVNKILRESSLINSNERTSFTKYNKTYSVGDIIDGNKLEELSGDLVGSEPNKKFVLVQAPLSNFKEENRESLLEEYEEYEKEDEIYRLESIKIDFEKTPPIPMVGDGFHRIVAAKELGHKTILMWQEISPKSISEAYHKAKEDGNNPNLVNAVEKLLGKPTDTKQIKAQKQSKDDAIQDAKDKYELSVEKRGKDHKTGVTAAIADLQKSDWYRDADDTQREESIREIKNFFGEKIKSAPSVGKITGKKKDTTVVSDLAAAIRDQIKLEAKAAREAAKDINERRKELGIAIKNVIKNYKGKISEKQLSAINDRISKANLLNDEMVDRVVDYVDKVMKDADYKEKLSKAKSERAAIKKLKKDSNRQAEVRAMATAFASIDPDLVEDIDEYMAMAEQVKNALKPTSISISNTTKFSDVYSYVDQYLEGQENIKKERILSNNPSLVEQGVIDKSMSLKDIESKIRRINDQKNKLNKATNSEELRDNLKEEVNSLKDILKSMLFGYNPITNEGVVMTDRIRQVISEISKLDVEDMSTEQMVTLVDSLNNFVKNGTIGGLDAAHKTYVGIKNANDLKRKGFVARQLKAYFSPTLGRVFGSEAMSLNELFTRLFGGVTRGNQFMEKSGVAGVVMGVNKAKKMLNAYQELYANTFKNVKGFFDQDNVYERGVLAFLSRTNSMELEGIEKEINRRIDLLLESYESLKNGTTEEQKMAKVYKEVFDRLNIESRDMNVIESNARQFNVDGAAWWMGAWQNHYEDLYDVSLSIYNTDLGKDFNYTSDRFSKLSESSEESFDQNLSERGSSFLINTENEKITDVSKAGVLIASTYPQTLKDKGRYVNLNFDINQSQALSGALVDIETAGSIRQVDAFINSDSFKSIIPNSSDRSLVVNRINKYIRRSKNKLMVPKDYARVIDKVINEAGRFGTTMALGGVFQFILQTFSVGINTLIQAGKYTQLYTGKSFNNWMDSTGTPTASRGMESVTSIENKMNVIDPIKSTLQEAARKYQKFTQIYMKTFLSKPDVFVARAAWKSYYLKYLSDNGYDTKKINWDTWNDTIKEEGIEDLHKKAMLFAESMVSRQQNVSDERLAGEIFSSEDGLRKAVRKILLPFAGFSMNQRMRLANDLITLTSARKISSKEDIAIAGRSLVGTLAEQATFNFIKFQVGKLIYYGAMSILGYGDDDEDEEEAKKRNINALKYPIKSFIGDMASPAPFLDDFTVWAIDKGIKPFMEPSESEINNAVNEENSIRRNALGKYDMNEDEKEEFIKKYKEDNTFSLESFKNDTGKYGLISVGSDAYEALHESLKMNDGKYTEDFQGKETEKYLTKDQIESQKIFSALKLFHFIGVLPREANQLADKGTRKIKQNSLTKNQYKSYEEFRTVFKREPKPYEIDIIKSTPYIIKEGYTEGSNQKMLENIYNIDQLGGLSDQQGKIYAKLMSTGMEITPQVYKLIQKGKTVEQIRKFIAN